MSLSMRNISYKLVLTNCIEIYYFDISTSKYNIVSTKRGNTEKIQSGAKINSFSILYKIQCKINKIIEKKVLQN